MIIDISDSNFRKIFQDKSLYLPIRWDGVDFYNNLENLLNNYCKLIEIEVNYLNEGLKKDRNNFGVLHIKNICNLIKKSVKHYLDGFPAKAYDCFSQVMHLLQQTPLRVYKKSCFEILENYDDRLSLYRVAKVEDNIPYARTRIFHTPYNLRSRVSSSRYSIAGYPSLYLGTSLELCCEEVHYNLNNGFAIASKFKIERSIEYNDTEINVIEIALKPQDFFEQNRDDVTYRRRFDEVDLHDPSVRSAYLLWYPLIAASSFIRTNKNHPFAAEYIVPQLLMQWVRSEMATNNEENTDYDHLIGIRYFSCASERASDMGFNYVFPVSGSKISSEYPYCPILAKAFRLTKPYFINEYPDIISCERVLRHDTDIDFIKN